ncbi:MAG: flagellar biosynthesis repressor FlbT [Sphingomonas sp.]|jgi:flagellar protein FlbT|uniref:flagellar biosynthesis repressor FlbT n=1 Tax=unclassified Sphingomonas TaxID=196159 RepID=UPI00053E1B6D|nr:MULTISPECIES: flagellar biosynthesis repressor FlbT [unclassified Sphingomonas]RUN76132.1 flagellar biosynthesis repressor FlbT [Sphingomonas sp. TF3]
MLRITLRDGEKAILNGAVISAVGRTQLRIENTVSILRGREVMRPEEATTPARQLYFSCMLAYIDPDGREKHQEATLVALRELLNPGAQDATKEACVRFANDIARGEFYRALAPARDLIALETPVPSFENAEA